jgi:formate hydrogenlyase subunit 6/NADH:ubiquinone oxidoreductase subunit I
MRIGAMLGDVMRSLVHAPVTERYPFEKKPAPERLRGRVIWTQDKCTGCGLCVMDCPAEAIELTVLDKANKKFIFTYHVDRCTFCAQCRVSCRQGCISLSSEDWELAGFIRGPYALHFGDVGDVPGSVASSTVDQAAAPVPA